MKSQPERTWSEVPDDELNDIQSTSPDRHLRRMAKQEIRKRKRQTAIQTRPVGEGNTNQVEIVAIRLSAGDLLTLAFKALPSIILIITTIWMVQLLLNILLMNVILQGVIEGMEPVKKSLEVM